MRGRHTSIWALGVARGAWVVKHQPDSTWQGRQRACTHARLLSRAALDSLIMCGIRRCLARNRIHARATPCTANAVAWQLIASLRSIASLALAVSSPSRAHAQYAEAAHTAAAAKWEEERAKLMQQATHLANSLASRLIRKRTHNQGSRRFSSAADSRVLEVSRDLSLVAAGRLPQGGTPAQTWRRPMALVLLAEVHAEVCRVCCGTWGFTPPSSGRPG